MKIVYVCTGNTCRSPMAEAVQRDLDDTIQVKSAGIYANEGEKMHTNAEMVLQEKNIVMDHAASTVTEEMLEWADLVLTMTESHKMLLSIHFPAYTDKYATLIEYTKENHKNENIETMDIDDPFGQSIAVYRHTLTQLKRYISFITKKAT